MSKWTQQHKHSTCAEIGQDWHGNGGDLKKLSANGPVDELVGMRILYQLLLALKQSTKRISGKDIKPNHSP